MAVLFRSQFPQEIVFIPKRCRFISFVDGMYETDKADEIAVLAEMYEHDLGDIEKPKVEEPKKRGPKPKEAVDGKPSR
jgi:hypothetical protein